MGATTAPDAHAHGYRMPPARAFVIFGAIALVVLVIGSYDRHWAWTGFTDNDTLWEWLKLLLLPIAIAALPIWLTEREFLDPRIRVGLVVATLAFVVLVPLGYLIPWPWTGFRGNALWDWLNLLLLPFVIVTVRRWSDIRPRLGKRHVVVVTVLFWILVGLVLAGYLVPWAWTGFTGNTLWDWIDLALAPLVLPLVLVPMSVDVLKTGVDPRVEHPQRALNDAVATAMVKGPSAGLEALEPLEERLADDPKYHAARAHLLEMSGEHEKARADYQAAATRAADPSQEEYLRKREARLRAGPERAAT